MIVNQSDQLTAAETRSAYAGTPVVPGVAFGPAVVVRVEVRPEAIAAYPGHSDAASALAAYDEACGVVAGGYAQRADATEGVASQVLAASAGLAKDRGLRKAVEKGLVHNADLLGALEAAIEQFAGMFTGLGGLMAERVADLRDVHRRIVAVLVQEPEPGVASPDAPSVVIAEDLAPVDTAGLDPTVVLALVTERGGPTSHTAIIARQLGIPCVVGVADVTDIAQATHVLVDGAAGTLTVGVPDTEARELVARDRAARAVADAWKGPGCTSDGVAIQLLANVADAESSRSSTGAPVEGVGLFRTELCFLNRTAEPSVEEQASIYADVLEPFAGRGKVVVRTLDAGSDKPIAFATQPGEANPALGVRGVRLTFDNPDLMNRQLDAIAAAAGKTGVDVRVMAPMIATVDEAADFAAKVRERGMSPGVMIEVPAAALQAAQMLEVVDFLSIGTNDLTQYTMAADRMEANLAHLADVWQPAVLQLIAITAQAGKRAGKPVGICGEAAADPLLAPVLVGLGVTSLSMASSAVRPVGARLSTLSMETCEVAAQAALASRDPHAARAAVRQALGDPQLDSL